MQGPDYLKFVIAFSVVIALMFALSWVLKKVGLAAVPMMPGAKRRLKIVEHIGIDARRRLVLVRRDGVEHLILIGQNQDCVIETNITPSADVIAVEVQKEQEQGKAA